MAAPEIQILRGLEANLPGLKAGEPAFTTNHENLYVGIDSTTVNNKFLGSARFFRKEEAGLPSQIRLVPGTAGVSDQYLALQVPNAGFAGTNTYVFPALNSGTSSNVLTIDSISSGVYTLSWQPGGSGGGSGGLITIRNDGSTVGTASSINTINFVGSAVEAIADPQPNGISTVTIATASDSQEGTAQFSASYFTVTSGDVAIDDAQADGSTKGISAFNSSDFTDSSGVISISSNLALDDVIVGGALTVTGESILSSATVSDLTQNRVVYSGASGVLQDSGNLQFNGTTLTIGSGVGVTQISNDITLAGSDATTIPTENAVKTYVDSQITAQDVDISGDSGTGSVDLDSQSLTVAGTANEVETAASGQTITIGLPNSVTITTELDVPTLEVNTIQHTNNTTALTIDTSGNVVAAQNFTISGNLFVNGSTTQVNTTELTIEDTIIQLGIVDGSAPASDLNVDLGIVFNWYDSQLRRATVFWDDSASRLVFASDATESSSVVTVSDYSPIESGSIVISDAAGTGENVISYLADDTLYTGQAEGRFLQNIIVDAGEF